MTTGFGGGWTSSSGSRTYIQDEVTVDLRWFKGGDNSSVLPMSVMMTTLRESGIRVYMSFQSYAANLPLDLVSSGVEDNELQNSSKTTKKKKE